MADPPLLIEQEAGALRLTLNRPEVLNALSPELLQALRQSLEAAAADETVRSVLLTGAGRGFCAGADLSATDLGADIGETLERHYHPVARALAGLAKPVIAAVNGVAAGAGMSVALACDLRLLSSAASFAFAFSGIGLVMDASGSYHLPRLVGRGRALELAYSNRRVGAEEALRIGIGEVLIDAEDFAAEAWAYARRLAAGPTRSFGLIKRQFVAAGSNDLEQQLALEAQLQAEAALTGDHREGLAAFREKRPPQFRGH